MATRIRRSSVIIAVFAASLACAYLGCRITGWLGVAVFGVLMMLVAVQIDMDSDAPMGTQQNTGQFAATMAARAAESRAEKAGRLAEA